VTHELTHMDWAEIYYAVDSKVARVKAGHYGPEETIEWAAHLSDIRDKLERLFEQEKITY